MNTLLLNENTEILQEIQNVLFGIHCNIFFFLKMQDAPAWQKNQLNSWNNMATNKPPSSLYDISKRGYPDVTMNGHNYQVAYSKGDNGECPCDIGGVDGTSASSPAFAGMISLINGHLLSNGQKQLGTLQNVLMLKRIHF